MGKINKPESQNGTKNGATITMLADILVKKTKKIVAQARNEEELKIGFEKIIEPILKTLDIKPSPHYERSSGQIRSVYRGRPDAIHGSVVLEYKSPGLLSAGRQTEKAFDQLVDQMIAELSVSEGRQPMGVGFDGQSIFFVKYHGQIGQPIERNRFTLNGPYVFDPHSAHTLLMYLKAMARRPLTAENLAAQFGPTSIIAPTAIAALVDALENWQNARVTAFYGEWMRLFGIVYGEQFGSTGIKATSSLADVYNIPAGTDFHKLLFSVHTYFALLMKFIAAELLSMRDQEFGRPLSSYYVGLSKKELKTAISDMESGGIYARQGITNFLEGDFFRWYMDAFSPGVEDAIRGIARGLSEFEPATTAIEPDTAHDLLKKLYQYLVPSAVRHSLGEYYTPDWLAELILKEVGYKGDSRKRLLDPACGSGTFLVLAIRQAQNAGKAEGEQPLEVAKRIIANIWGFDLNPLAVIASRTNYIFALGDLVHALESVEIPVYLADSVLWPERGGQMDMDFVGGESIPVPTSVKIFHIPAIWVKNRGLLMSKAAPLVERLAKDGFSAKEALDSIRKEGLVFPPHEETVRIFYDEILELERSGKNGIWARLLKNTFAPTNAGRFDFVVGNPPWIRWGYLSKEYREATLPMWKRYGLFSLKGHAARLGGGEKDFSMLFTYAAADFYLGHKGRLGFLITQEVFKSKGAGEGFRRFKLGEQTPLKVVKAHDLVALQPFEKAANKTAAIFLQKGEPTVYPVKYTVWTKKKRTIAISSDLSLAQALFCTERTELLAQPIGISPSASWKTLAAGNNDLSNVEGANNYQARLGARAEPYGVFWLELKQVMANGDLLVRNMCEKGKRDIGEIETRIENALVFPAVRGADIDRWAAKPGIYVLLSQNAETREPYPESQMKSHWPRTFGYLTNFKNVLETRGSRAVVELAQKTEFYAMYGIGQYTLAPYKVVWKRMANDITGAVISQYKTPFGFKLIIPTDTTSFFASNSESEAHYLCAIINSSAVREFIKSYSSAGRGFGAPSVMNHVGIPKFNPRDPMHISLSEKSLALHENASTGAKVPVDIMQGELEAMVKVLFAIHG